MRLVLLRSLGLALVVGSLVQGCGGDAGDADGSDTVAAADSASNAATATTASAGATEPATPEMSVTVEDIDRWQRGMEAELAAVREAGTKYKEAKTSTDSMNAMFATLETSTRAAGARGAGLDEQRYGIVRSSLSALASSMAPLEQEMDVSKMPSDAVAQLKAARDTGLMLLTPKYNPAVIEALRPRAAALRKQELELVVERMRAAGQVQ